jgi:hypothetical protein
MKKIATAWSLKFLGLSIDTSLTWKHHISELTSRLNKACYVIRTIKPFMSLGVLRSTYFSYVHSIISNGIIFWGNSSHSEVTFKIQKRIIMNSSKKGLTYATAITQGYCNTSFAAFKHTDPKCVLVELPVVTQPVCKTVPCSHHSTTILNIWILVKSFWLLFKLFWFECLTVRDVVCY